MTLQGDYARRAGISPTAAAGLIGPGFHAGPSVTQGPSLENIELQNDL